MTGFCFFNCFVFRVQFGDAIFDARFVEPIYSDGKGLSKDYEAARVRILHSKKAKDNNIAGIKNMWGKPFFSFCFGKLFSLRTNTANSQGENHGEAISKVFLFFKTARKLKVFFSFSVLNF
jgi:hypothetical protein